MIQAPNGERRCLWCWIAASGAQACRNSTILGSPITPSASMTALGSGFGEKGLGRRGRVEVVKHEHFVGVFEHLENRVRLDTARGAYLGRFRGMGAGLKGGEVTNRPRTPKS